MAQRPHEILWRYDFDRTGGDRFTGNAAHILDESNAGVRYKDRSITIKNGKAVLAGSNDRIKGAFQYFSSGKAVVKVESAGTRFKNAGTTVLSTGDKIIGATRVIESGGTAENGYVQAAPESPSPLVLATSGAQITRALKGIGYVDDGGGVYPANTDSEADVIVMHSMGG